MTRTIHVTNRGTPYELNYDPTSLDETRICKVKKIDLSECAEIDGTWYAKGTKLWVVDDNEPLPFSGVNRSDLDPYPADDHTIELSDFYSNGDAGDLAREVARLNLTDLTAFLNYLSCAVGARALNESDPVGWFLVEGQRNIAIGADCVDNADAAESTTL